MFHPVIYTLDQKQSLTVGDVLEHFGEETVLTVGDVNYVKKFNGYTVLSGTTFFGVYFRQVRSNELHVDEEFSTSLLHHTREVIKDSSVEGISEECFLSMMVDFIYEFSSREELVVSANISENITVQLKKDDVSGRTLVLKNFHTLLMEVLERTLRE